MITENRPWGTYSVIFRSDDIRGVDTWTKIITIHPGESLSLQYHHYRTEHWVALDPGVQARIRNETLDLEPGVRYTVPRETVHRLSNSTDAPVRVIEVAVGPVVEESDIVRLSDKYGRHK